MKPFGSTNALLDDIVNLCADQKMTSFEFDRKYGKDMRIFVFRVWRPEINRVWKESLTLESEEEKTALYKKLNGKLSLFCAAFV